ncbi:MAG: hypothetical protein IJL19_04910 [Clostridiales bacterium]|nr:hypothetical protein [Clostridiales bacterium]
MRSEERAGIISIVMLFLWGTLIAEPFHIFARYIASGVTYALKGLGAGGIVLSLALYLVVTLVIVLMQKISKTKFGIYIPCVISTVLIVLLVFKSIVKASVDVSDAICLAIPAVCCVALYLLKKERGLKWITDIYTYSLAIALLNALLFVPIAKLNTTVAKILYITKYNDLHITGSFAGLAGIPELVWGFFLTAFVVFPIIYLATSGRRK